MTQLIGRELFEQRFMLTVTLLSVSYKPFTLSVVILNVFILSAFMVSAIMLSVVAPLCLLILLILGIQLRLNCKILTRKGSNFRTSQILNDSTYNRPCQQRADGTKLFMVVENSVLL